MEISANMVPLMALLIPIIALLGAFTMVVFLRKYDNDEKMAMIAKGITPPQKVRSNNQMNSFNSLRLGFVIIGFGIGLLAGNVLEKLVEIDSEAAHFSMIFIFGGLGLLLSYFYQIKNKNNEK
jgi:hypothetical protein